MSWMCPYCKTAAIIRKDDMMTTDFDLNSSDGIWKYTTIGIVCPNPECHKPTIIIEDAEYIPLSNTYILSNTKNTYRVIPKTTNKRAKEYPSYVPSSIFNDYQEACAIVDLSPKASATLARRCLQGMIRDFWEVSGKKSLHHEIEAIEDKVDPDVWKAILNLKSIGNIGAHMEKDINLIIDVSPEEADLLIEMIEMLLDDWYVARHERQQRLQRIEEVAAEKAEARKGGLI